jgi:glycerol-3-phosphate dehydrogenase
MSSRVIETQVAIIGGGITGTAIARELSKYKVDISLLEKDARV